MNVTVIGSGIMGLCSAYYLNKSGATVTVLDTAAAPSGASMGNAGMIVPSHFMPLAAPGVLLQAIKWMFKSDSPFALHPRLSTDLLRWGLAFMKASRKKDISNEISTLLALNLESRALYKKMIQDEQWEVGFQEKGLLMICNSQAALEHEAALARKSEALSLPVDRVDAGRVSELCGMEVSTNGGVYYPQDAYLTPHVLLSYLHDHLSTQGVTFQYSCGEIGLSRQGNRLEKVIVKGESIPTDQLLIAAGMGSVNLAKQLKERVVMTGGKGYTVTVANPPKTPGVSGILVEARVAFTPMLHGLRIGGTMELGADPVSVNRKRLDGIFRSVKKSFPDFQAVDFPELPVWTALRPITPTGLPLMGKLGTLEDVWICTGHGMMGLSLGAVSGKKMSDMMK